MSDPGDGAGRDGPSDDPADEDPFEYPSDGRDGIDDRHESDDRARAGRADERTEAGRPDDQPDPESAAQPRGVGGWLKWFWTTDSGAAMYVRDVFTSVAAVLFVGLLLFAVSGIWPPMVAVESSSMEPNMNVGDLVFVVDNERFVPDAAVPHDGETTGVVPADRGAEVGHTEFGRHGDVIVFMPDGDERQTPVIHRAMLFVEAGENWYDRADESAVGSAEDCEELDYCPAPHAGFITQGDNERTNENYDQVSGLSEPVRPGWVIGTAEVKVPYLGHVRLAFSGQVAVLPDASTASTAGVTTAVRQGEPAATRGELAVTPDPPAATLASDDSRTTAAPGSGPARPVA